MTIHRAQVAGLPPWYFLWVCRRVPHADRLLLERMFTAEWEGDSIMTTLRVLAAVALVLTIMGIAVLAVLGRAVVRGVQWAGTPARHQPSHAKPCLAVVEHPQRR